jgi:hypothetical protein
MCLSLHMKNLNRILGKTGADSYVFVKILPPGSRFRLGSQRQFLRINADPSGYGSETLPGRQTSLGDIPPSSQNILISRRIQQISFERTRYLQTWPFERLNGSLTSRCSAEFRGSRRPLTQAHFIRLRLPLKEYQCLVLIQSETTTTKVFQNISSITI